MHPFVEDKKSANSMIAVKHMNRAQFEESQQEDEQFGRISGIQQALQQHNLGDDTNSKPIIQSKQDKSVRLSKLNEEEAAIIFENRKKELFESLMSQIKRSGSNSASRKKTQNYNSSLNTSIQKERSSSVGKSRGSSNQIQSQTIMKQSSYIDNSHQHQQENGLKIQLQQVVTQQPQKDKQKQSTSLERANSANISSKDRKFIIFNEKFTQPPQQNQVLKKRNSFTKNPVSSDRESIYKSKPNVPKSTENPKSKLKTNYALLNQLKKESPKQNQIQKQDIKVNNYLQTNLTKVGSNSAVFQQQNHNPITEKDNKKREGQISDKIGMTSSTHSLIQPYHIATTNRTPSKITSQQKGQYAHNDKEFGLLLQNGSKQHLVTSSQRIGGQVQQNSQTQYQSNNNNNSSSNLSSNFIRSNSLQTSSQNQAPQPYTIDLINAQNSSSQQSSPKRTHLKSQSQIYNQNMQNKSNKSELELYLSQSSNASSSQINQQISLTHRPSSSISDISSLNNLSKPQKFITNNGSATIKANSDRPQTNMLSYAKIYNNLMSQAKSTQPTASDTSPIERHELMKNPQNFYSAHYNYQNSGQVLRKQESDSSTQAFDSDQDKQGGKYLQTLNENPQKYSIDSKKLSLSYVKLQSQALIKKQLEKQKNNSKADQNINNNNNKSNNNNYKQELMQNIGDLNQQIVQIEKNEIIQRKPSLNLDTSPFSRNSAQDQSIRDLQSLLQNSKRNQKSYSSLHSSGKALIGNNSISKSRSKDQFQSIQSHNKIGDAIAKPFSSQASTPKSKKKIQFSTNVSTTATNTGEKTPLKSILVNGKNNSHSTERLAHGFSESAFNQLGLSDSAKQKDLTINDNLQSNSNLSQIKIQSEREEEENMKKSKLSSQNDLSYKSLTRINSAQFIDFRPKSQNYKSKTHLQQALVRKMSENENLYTDIKNKVQTTNDLKTLSSLLIPPSTISMNGVQSQKYQKMKTSDGNEKYSRHSPHESMYNSQVSIQHNSISNNNNNTSINDQDKNLIASTLLSCNDRSNRQKYINQNQQKLN